MNRSKEHTESGVLFAASSAVHVASASDDLASLVRRYRMRWRARPEHAVIEGELVTIGYVVELAAARDSSVGLFADDGHECARMSAALEHVARAVLPPGSRALGPRGVWYEVDVDDAEVEYDPARGRAETCVTISILHEGANRPADAQQRVALDEIRSRLFALGVREE